MAPVTLPCAVLVPGSADGDALVSSVPISLWGGLNPETGEVIDRRHPLSGETLAGRWLVVPHGRGSCSASGVFLEAAHNGRAPCGVIVSQPDPVLGLGAILASELLDIAIPMLQLSEADRSRIATGDRLRFDGTSLTLDRVAVVTG